MTLKKPKLKTLHNAYKEENGSIRIGGTQFGVASRLEDPDGFLWQILRELDGTKTIDQITLNLNKNINENFSEDAVESAINQLTELGYIEDLGGVKPENLNPDDIERYERNTHYFSWVGMKPSPSRLEYQSRLKNSKVAIIGLGGTGSSVAMSLAAAGIGHLHCVDFDVVEKSNLSRQFLYSESNIGALKIDCAIERLKALNSSIQITGENMQIESVSQLEKIAEGVDFLILCADKPKGKIAFWVNEACLTTKTPWMESAYAGPMLVCGAFIPGQTPCRMCFQLEQEKRESTEGIDRDNPLFPIEEVNAVIAPTAAIPGQFAALEVINFLAGLKLQTAGRIFHQNFMHFDHQYWIETEAKTDCPSCGNKA